MSDLRKMKYVTINATASKIQDKIHTPAFAAPKKSRISWSVTGTGSPPRKRVFGLRRGRFVIGVRPPVLSLSPVGDKISWSRRADEEGVGEATLERGSGCFAATVAGVFERSKGGEAAPGADIAFFSSSRFSRSRSFSFLLGLFLADLSAAAEVGLPGAVDAPDAPLVFGAASALPFAVSWTPT